MADNTLSKIFKGLGAAASSYGNYELKKYELNQLAEEKKRQGLKDLFDMSRALESDSRAQETLGLQRQELDLKKEETARKAESDKIQAQQKAELHKFEVQEATAKATKADVEAKEAVADFNLPYEEKQRRKRQEAYDLEYQKELAKAEVARRFPDGKELEARNKKVLDKNTKRLKNEILAEIPNALGVVVEQKNTLAGKMEDTFEFHLPWQADPTPGGATPGDSAQYRRLVGGENEGEGEGLVGLLTKLADDSQGNTSDNVLIKLYPYKDLLPATLANKVDEFYQYSTYGLPDEVQGAVDNALIPGVGVSGGYTNPSDTAWYNQPAIEGDSARYADSVANPLDFVRASSAPKPSPTGYPMIQPRQTDVNNEQGSFWDWIDEVQGRAQSIRLINAVEGLQSGAGWSRLGNRIKGGVAGTVGGLAGLLEMFKPKGDQIAPQQGNGFQGVGALRKEESNTKPSRHAAGVEMASGLVSGVASGLPALHNQVRGVGNDLIAGLGGGQGDILDERMQSTFSKNMPDIHLASIIGRAFDPATVADDQISHEDWLKAAVTESEVDPSIGYSTALTPFAGGLTYSIGRGLYKGIKGIVKAEKVAAKAAMKAAGVGTEQIGYEQPLLLEYKPEQPWGEKGFDAPSDPLLLEDNSPKMKSLRDRSAPQAERTPHLSEARGKAAKAEEAQRLKDRIAAQRKKIEALPQLTDPSSIRGDVNRRLRESRLLRDVAELTPADEAIRAREARVRAASSTADTKPVVTVDGNGIVVEIGSTAPPPFKNPKLTPTGETLKAKLKKSIKGISKKNVGDLLPVIALGGSVGAAATIDYLTTDADDWEGYGDESVLLSGLGVAGLMMSRAPLSGLRKMREAAAKVRNPVIGGLGASSSFRPLYEIAEKIAKDVPEAQGFSYAVNDASHNIAVAKKKYGESLDEIVKKHGVSGNEVTQASRRIAEYAVAKMEQGAEWLEASGVDKKNIPVGAKALEDAWNNLTAFEKDAYRHWRSTSAGLYNQDNVVRSQFKLPELHNRADYFPLSSTDEYMEQLRAYDIDKLSIRKKTDQTRFAHEKRGDKPHAVTLDFFKVTGDYVNQTLEHIHLTPAIGAANDILNDLEISKKLPELHNDLQTWKKQVAGIKESKMDATTKKIVSTLRHNQTVSRLAYGLSTTVSNMTTFINTTGMIGPTYTARGYARLMAGGTAEAMNKSRVLLARTPDIAFHRNMADRFQGGTLSRSLRAGSDIGMSAIKFIDHQNAVAAWYGGYERALKSGANEAKAARYADEVVLKTQGSGDHVQLSNVQRTELGGLLTQFGTFTIGNWSYLRNDAFKIRRKYHGKYDPAGAILSMIVAGAAMDAIIEDGMGMNSPIPNPIRGAMEGGVSGAIGEAMSVLPVIGSGRYATESMGGALASSIGSLASGAQGGETSKKRLVTAAASLLPVPGAVNVARSAMAYAEGDDPIQAFLGINQRKKDKDNGDSTKKPKKKVTKKIIKRKK